MVGNNHPVLKPEHIHNNIWTRSHKSLSNLDNIRNDTDRSIIQKFLSGLGNGVVKNHLCNLEVYCKDNDQTNSLLASYDDGYIVVNSGAAMAFGKFFQNIEPFKIRIPSLAAATLDANGYVVQGQAFWVGIDFSTSDGFLTVRQLSKVPNEWESAPPEVSNNFYPLGYYIPDGSPQTNSSCFHWRAIHIFLFDAGPFYDRISALRVVVQDEHNHFGNNKLLEDVLDNFWHQMDSHTWAANRIIVADADDYFGDDKDLESVLKHFHEEYQSTVVAYYYEPQIFGNASTTYSVGDLVSFTRTHSTIGNIPFKPGDLITIDNYGTLARVNSVTDTPTPETTVTIIAVLGTTDYYFESSIYGSAPPPYTVGDTVLFQRISSTQDNKIFRKDDLITIDEAGTLARITNVDQETGETTATVISLSGSGGHSPNNTYPLVFEWPTDTSDFVLELSASDLDLPSGHNYILVLNDTTCSVYSDDDPVNPTITDYHVHFMWEPVIINSPTNSHKYRISLYYSEITTIQVSGTHYQTKYSSEFINGPIPLMQGYSFTTDHEHPSIFGGTVYNGQPLIFGSPYAVFGSYPYTIAHDAPPATLVLSGIAVALP